MCMVIGQGYKKEGRKMAFKRIRDTRAENQNKLSQKKLKKQSM